jgi:very-short-patch-repair endonuclease/transposase-like protein
MKCEVCDKEFKNMGGYSKHIKTCKYVNTIKDNIIYLYVESLISINEISKKFNLGKNTIIEVLGDKKRNISEGIKTARKKYPDRFKHSDETKEKIRVKRIEFMKNNPDKTAWRTSNLSYPEKLFLNKLKELKWDENYSIIREYCVFPYFIDFAFPNEKVAIEIDGSQHLLSERKEHDEKKDNLLTNEGWYVIRVTEKEVKMNIDNVFIMINNIIKNKPSIKKYEIGILEYPKGYQKKEKNTFRFTKSIFEYNLKQRRVERPDYETLKQEVNEFGFLGTGKKYGVSDNSIRKWLKFYERTGGKY